MSIPTPAERARTILRLAPCLRVRTPGAWAEVELHGTDPDGSVVLVLAEQSPVVGAVRRAGADLPVLVDAADLCPVPVADRVRGRLRLVGWMHEPAPTLRRELALVAADEQRRRRAARHRLRPHRALRRRGRGAGRRRRGRPGRRRRGHLPRPGRVRDGPAGPAGRHRGGAARPPRLRPSDRAAPAGRPTAQAGAGRRPSRSRWTATGWSCVAAPATCGSHSGAPVRCPRELPGRMRELLARARPGRDAAAVMSGGPRRDEVTPRYVRAGPPGSYARAQAASDRTECAACPPTPPPRSRSATRPPPSRRR